jgi:hypothetical protein
MDANGMVGIIGLRVAAARDESHGKHGNRKNESGHRRLEAGETF